MRPVIIATSGASLRLNQKVTRPTGAAWRVNSFHPANIGFFERTGITLKPCAE